MKILKGILFLYFTCFFFVGASAIKSFFLKFSPKIEYSFKDIKKEKIADESDDDTDIEEVILNDANFHYSTQGSLSVKNFGVVYSRTQSKFFTNIVIPPPDFNI